MLHRPDVGSVPAVEELAQRAYRATDASALSSLMNIIDEHAAGQPRSSPASIEHLIASAVVDTTSDSRLMFTPDGAMVAAGLTIAPPEGASRVQLIGGVHPAWRRRGIGRRLLSWQLSRAAEIHRAVAPEAPWQAVVNSKDAEAGPLFRRFDFAQWRSRLELVAATAAPATVAPLDGLRIAPYSARYEEGLHVAHSEAFPGTPTLQEWAAESVRSKGFRPELSPVALDGDELIGYVLCYEEAGPEMFRVHVMGVRQPWRRRGVATALLVEMLNAGREAGRATARLEVNADDATGALGVCERVGFAVSARSTTYSVPLINS